MSEHTPGPWTFAPRGTSVTGRHGERVVTVAHVERTYSVLADEALANRRLIAAAPDLLAALKLFMAASRSYTEDHVEVAMGDWVDAAFHAVQAIAKCEGRQP